MPSTNTVQGRQQHTAQEVEKKLRPQWSSNRARALGQSPQGPGTQHLELTPATGAQDSRYKHTDAERNKLGHLWHCFKQRRTARQQSQLQLSWDRILALCS